jgi:hypothetical protein
VEAGVIGATSSNSAADGALGVEAVASSPSPARSPSRPRPHLLRHRRLPHHKQTRRWRPVQTSPGPDEVLG